MKSESKTFLDDIQSQNENVQLKAWTQAGAMSAEVIPPLCELLASEDMKTAKAADEALKRITHSVGKSFEGKCWRAVVDGYVKVLRNKYPSWSKAIALRHLSMIGDEKPVRTVAKCLNDERLAEEAVFCLERIEGKAATTALTRGLRKACGEFKPRILEALGRRGDPAALRSILEEYRSGEKPARLAAVRAIAQIGVDPGDWEMPSFSEFDPLLTVTERRKLMNSLLLFCDKMIEGGVEGEWFNWLSLCVKYESEEHLRCAAIVSLGKLAQRRRGSAVAQAATRTIELGLNDEAYIVRITAQKALNA